MSTVLALLLPLLVAAGAWAQQPPPPWQRTETREPCAAFDVLRRPFVGDTHVHTTYSFDAVTGDVRAKPRDAYDFAKGAVLGLPPYDAQGNALRATQLDRPLDFTAVTDHSELFGEVHLCLTPGSPAYDTQQCVIYRSGIPQLTQQSTPGIVLFGATYTGVEHPARFDFCGPGGGVCLGAASLVWQDTQQAAEQHYDRSSACGFTTFVAYEWTGTPGVQNLHRNVIFRNEHVTPLPISYVEQNTPQGLWSALHAQCLDTGIGCDVLAIPHNSNVSNGLMFLPENADHSPLTAADAAERAAMEPLVEIMQHKGDSECRTGILTNDELCGFEKWSSTRIGLPPAPDQVFSPLLFVRNALKEGLAQEQRVGVNPFRLGLIGSTDTHNATPGNVREDAFPGHLGTRDATPALQMSTLDGIGVIGGVEANPGGLAFVWAEENSRDALFAAMRRREVYGSSGTRPLLRFFAGELDGVACDRGDLVQRAYADGVPMGGEIGAVRGAKSPRFAVLATKDPGTSGHPGTPLQRLQIVKGWVDAGGASHEQVYDVAGSADDGSTVDTATCTATSRGADSFCTVWEDPGFDRAERAFYYARLVEDPVCRWSTRLCNAQHVDCAAGAPAGLEQCCNPAVPKTVQERAWSSPIWYRPEALGRLSGRIRFGKSAGSDVLVLAGRVGQLPAGFDPGSQSVAVRVTDDDTILDVVVPRGAMVAHGRNRWTLVSGVEPKLERLTLRRGRNGETVLSLRTRKMDLASADRVGHFVDVSLRFADVQLTHSRLWRMRGSRLDTQPGGA